MYLFMFLRKYMFVPLTDRQLYGISFIWYFKLFTECLFIIYY